MTADFSRINKVPGLINRSTSHEMDSFAELKARGIVNSWNILRRRIEHDGFPRPRKLGDHIHAWPEAEVQQWLDSRPLGGPVPLSGAASAKRKAELAARLDALSRAHRAGAAEIEHQRKQAFIEQRPDEATA